MTATSPVPEAIHPSLWRASQLARGRGRTVETGYPALSAELPGGGWPIGALVDLLVQQAGVGEMRLLRPAICTLGKRQLQWFSRRTCRTAPVSSTSVFPQNSCCRSAPRRRPMLCGQPSRFCVPEAAAHSCSGRSTSRRLHCGGFIWPPSLRRRFFSWFAHWRPRRMRPPPFYDWR